MIAPPSTSPATTGHPSRPNPVTGLCRWLVLVVILVGPGCISLKPDVHLQRLYDICAPETCSDPVVLIHGAFGSRLAAGNGEQLWPRSLLDLLLGHYPDIGLAIDPEDLNPRPDGTAPYALFDHAGEADFYGRILDTLEHAGRFRRAQPGTPQPVGGRVYYIFLYDWRRDLVKVAGELEEFIERIRADFGNPDLRINLVAHSAGAILARYYARYGGEDVLNRDSYPTTLAGTGKLRNLIMVGAPNRGAVSALHTLIRGYKVGFGTIPPEVIATMPAAYQMLPHPDQPWLIDVDGKDLKRDLYDPQLWRDQQWSFHHPDAQRRLRDQDRQEYASVLQRFHAAQLLRARALHRALSTPLPETRLRYITIGGDCVATPQRLLLQNENGREVIRIKPEEVRAERPLLESERMMLTAGDGRVTKLSALGLFNPRHNLGESVDTPFPLHHSLFLCEAHSQLTGNLHFQTNLLNILLRQEPFPGTATR